jgi:hypothetical protein
VEGERLWPRSSRSRQKSEGTTRRSARRGQSVSANGEETDWHYEETGGKIVIQLVESATETMVEVRF